MSRLWTVVMVAVSILIPLGYIVIQTRLELKYRNKLQIKTAIIIIIIIDHPFHCWGKILTKDMAW